MIQDIYPHQFHNEYRPTAQVRPDSPVLYFQDRKVLLASMKFDLEAADKHNGRSCDGGQKDPSGISNISLASYNIFPSWQALGCCPVVYAFAVDEQECFLAVEALQPAADGCVARTGAAAAVPDGTVEGQSEEKVDEFQIPDGYAFYDLREVRALVEHVYGMIIYTGIHLHQWYGANRFCGSCGERTVHDTVERAMLCPACGKKIYPRLNPAVIVGVRWEDKLLVTKYRTGYGYYALVAGFAEIGETLEETVSREVMEETGLRIRNIRYYKSQPWGIAQDLLAGFYCDVDGDPTIRLDTNELRLAEWKRRAEIELQPDSYSLTNEMMRRFRDGECGMV